MTTSPGSTAPQPPADPAEDPGDIRDQLRRLRAEGGTYRSIAAAAGLAPATVHDLATGRRNPTPATTRALLKLTAARCPAPGSTQAAPGYGSAPCTSWATAPPASPAPSAPAR